MKWHDLMGFFFKKKTYKGQTILLVSHGFETVLVSNKLSADNSVCSEKLHLELECETLDFQMQFHRAKLSSLHSIC